jgi:hypothetical protein
MSAHKQMRRGLSNSRYLLARALVAVPATMASLTIVFSAGAPAYADTPAHGGTTQEQVPSQILTLSKGESSGVGYQWVVSGSGFTPGQSDVQLWVQDVTGGGWNTLEYQSGLTTSRSTIYWGDLRVVPGGALSAEGVMQRVLVGPDVGYGLEAVHPLRCGQKYEAVASDPLDGRVDSNVLEEPACQALPK